MILIRPGTDAALVNGLAYVMITENLVDQAFLDKYCVGYDEKTLPASAPKNGHYKAYILGEGQMAWLKRRNGPRKSPVFRQTKSSNWLMKSAVPNRRLSAGWGPQRHANGEIATRAISMLAILTGNVGINGGNSGAREGSYSLPFVRMPTLKTRSRPAFRCLCGPMPLNVARK